jgi:hypothetical protein
VHASVTAIPHSFVLPVRLAQAAAAVMNSSPSRIDFPELTAGNVIMLTHCATDAKIATEFTVLSVFFLLFLPLSFISHNSPPFNHTRDRSRM